MSKKLVIRMDDLGYTEGVTLGMLSVVAKGYPISAALMVNETYSAQAAKLAVQYDNLCLGIHISFSSGTPASPVELIPSLVDENGAFLTSKVQRAKMAQGIEPFDRFDEVAIEIRSQVEKFISLTGQKPKYIDLHALQTEGFMKGIEVVGKELRIPHSPYYAEQHPENLIYFEADDTILENGATATDYFSSQKVVDGYNLMVTHPAFVDYDLTTKSTLAFDRVKDYGILTDDDLIKWWEDNDIQLMTFEEI